MYLWRMCAGKRLIHRSITPLNRGRYGKELERNHPYFLPRGRPPRTATPLFSSSLLTPVSLSSVSTTSVRNFSPSIAPCLFPSTLSLRDQVHPTTSFFRKTKRGGGEDRERGRRGTKIRICPAGHVPAVSPPPPLSLRRAMIPFPFECPSPPPPPPLSLSSPFPSFPLVVFHPPYPWQWFVRVPLPTQNRVPFFLRFVSVPRCEFVVRAPLPCPQDKERRAGGDANVLGP